MPTVAIPSPLTAGPTNMPIMAVLATRALAAVNCVRSTMSGTVEDKAGLNTVVTTAMRKTTI